MKAMEAFVTSVKKRGLGAAAQSLGISRTLVSRNIQALEEALGVRLLNRTTRSLSLTEAGQKYFNFCDDLMSRIGDMDRQISAAASDAKGELSILAPKWLQSTATKLLVAFAKAHPEIRPRLVLGGMAQTAYGFLEQGCEVALHTRKIPDSRILAKRLLEIPFSLCASPDYLASGPTLTSPTDIEQHQCLVQYNFHTWLFEQDGRVERIQPNPTFSTNTFLALREAARDGLGLVLLPKPLVAADIDDGQLIEVLTDWRPASQDLYVAIAPGRGVPVKVRLLLDFISEWFQREGMDREPLPPLVDAAGKR